jgi:hypothetical protein
MGLTGDFAGGSCGSDGTRDVCLLYSGQACHASEPRGGSQVRIEPQNLTTSVDDDEPRSFDLFRAIYVLRQLAV